MPDVFLRNQGAVTVGQDARVFGRASDGDRIFLDAAATDVRVDANVERIDLDRGLADLSFQVTGDGLQIVADGDIVATIASLNQATDLVTRVGDVAISQVAAGVFEVAGASGQAVRVDGDDPTPVDVTPGRVTPARPANSDMPAAAVFLDAGERFVASESVEVRGPGSGDATVALGADARDVRTDANITRLELPRAFDAVDMRVTDSGLEIAADGDILANVPSLNQPTEAVFADGGVLLTQTGAARFDVVGANTTATLDRGGLDGDVVPAAQPGGDGTPTVRVADAQAVEGGALAFDVTTTNLAVGTELAYTITPGSAESADLLAPLSGDVTVASQGGGATAVIRTADDAKTESATETITLAITDPDSDARDTATGSIQDNDGEPRDTSAPVPDLTVADASAREGGMLRFDVSSSDLPAGAEIDWRLAFTGARAADVAGATSGTAVLDAGNGAITVKAADDARIETGGPETFEVIATNRATGARATATGEIVDNDGVAGLDALTVTDPSTTEGGVLTFAVIAPAPVDDDRRFPWELDLDDTPPSLVTGETSGTVTIPAGSTRAEVTVATVDDSTARTAPDTVTLTLGDGGGTVLASATGTIRDDDPVIPPDVPVLTVGDATATEGETLEIPFALSKPAPPDTAIVGGLDSDRAGPGVDADDFPGDQVSDVVRLAEGETNGVLRLPVADDDAVEGTETFGVSASSPNLAETDVRFGEATILDNDGPSTAASAGGGQTDAVEPMAV